MRRIFSSPRSGASTPMAPLARKLGLEVRTTDALMEGHRRPRCVRPRAATPSTARATPCCAPTATSSRDPSPDRPGRRLTPHRAAVGEGLDLDPGDRRRPRHQGPLRPTPRLTGDTRSQAAEAVPPLPALKVSLGEDHLGLGVDEVAGDLEGGDGEQLGGTAVAAASEPGDRRRTRQAEQPRLPARPRPPPSRRRSATPAGRGPRADPTRRARRRSDRRRRRPRSTPRATPRRRPRSPPPASARTASAARAFASASGHE